MTPLPDIITLNRTLMECYRQILSDINVGTPNYLWTARLNCAAAIEAIDNWLTDGGARDLIALQRARELRTLFTSCPAAGYSHQECVDGLREEERKWKGEKTA